GRYDAAERELRSALDLAPTYARARFALGVVLLKQGEHAEARNAFARATTDAAGDPALQNIAAAMRDSIKI
ncbi:MAG TPA: tetratricopeptide repeat protein, partial [Candidatus Nitrosotalea sp.]|nr:tetratricopeptide repeat protein [Candidatus Nitrosotalea sp.]